MSYNKFCLTYKIIFCHQACQIDIIREKGHEYFITTLIDIRSTNGVRALAAFNLTCLVDNHTKAQVITSRLFA